MSIIEKAHELGKAITEDPRFIAYETARKIQEDDDLLQAELLAYEGLRNKVIAANEANAPEEQIKALSDELTKKYESIIAMDSMSNFIRARNDVDQILKEINGIIDFYVTGEEPSEGCGGNCGSCCGCH